MCLAPIQTDPTASLNAERARSRGEKEKGDVVVMSKVVATGCPTVSIVHILSSGLSRGISTYSKLK